MHKLIESTEIFIKSRLESDISDGHDYTHTCRVVKHALALCDQLPEADRTVVHLAALLHDVARPEESASAGKIDHAAAGAEIAGEFLQTLELEETRKKAIVQAIREHRYRSGNKPTSLESQIIYDADKLDSLGAVGIARAFLFAGHVGAKLHNTAEAALAGEAYSVEDTAYREYLVKLSHLPEKMQTAPGKLLAEERKVFMQEFFDRLNEEFFD